MAGKLFLWQMKASGPARLKTSLVRNTRGVLKFLTRLGSSGQLRNGFPPSVTGDQLADLAGSRLSALLRGEESPSVTARDGRRSGLSQFPLLSESPKQPGNLERPQSRPPAEVETTSTISAFSRSRDPFRLSSGDPTGQATADAQLPLPAPRSKAAPDQFPVVSSPRHAPFLAGPLHRRVRPASLFVQQLAKYFSNPAPVAPAIHQPELPHRPFAEPSFLVGQAGRPKAPGFPSAQVNSDGARSWPEISAQRLAERLNHFVSGEAMPPDLLPAAEASEGLGKVEVQNIFHIQVNPQAGEIASLQDLSTQVADVLREQAIQHGIDIT
jgi:hypothetical protein